MHLPKNNHNFLIKNWVYCFLPQMKTKKLIILKRNAENIKNKIKILKSTYILEKKTNLKTLKAIFTDIGVSRQS